MAAQEEKLAEEAKRLVSSFNFSTRKPSKKKELQEAKDLYRKIFYEKDFTQDKSKSMSLDFNNDIFSKVTSCSRCAKSVYEQLKKFSDWVLE